MHSGPAPLLASKSESTPVLVLQLLGYPTLVLNGIPPAIPLPAKALALLVFLCVESQRQHSREELVALLWPESSRKDGLNSLRQALFTLRKVLPTAPPTLLTSRQSVGIDPTTNLWLDVTAFGALLDSCQSHSHPTVDTCPACAARLEEAVGLYKGDFLAGFSLADSDAFHTWQVAQQESRRDGILTALSDLASFYTRRQQYGQAIGHLQHALTLVPWHERSHRQLMRVLALDGQRSAALNQFEVCLRVLTAELHTAPASETLALRQHIEAGLLEQEVIQANNPYRGLHAFDEKHIDEFYGREQVVQRLLAAVEKEPLVVLVGPSGSGKSSLLYAGLLPKLRSLGSTPSSSTAQYSNENRPAWVVVDFQPDEEPFYSLAEALSPLLTLSLEPAALATLLRQGDCTLADLASSLSPSAGPSPPRLLFVIDSFEKLYSLCPDPQTRQDFLDLLLLPSIGQTVGRRRQKTSGPEQAVERVERDAAPRSLPPMPSFSVILSLRADFVSQALSYRPLADAIQRGGVIVGPMNRFELHQVVEQPALSQGVNFESGLVERLLTDVGSEPGNLPLLQFCLTQLWGRQRAATLTHAAYDDIGGLAGALSLYADRVFDKLEAAEQDAVRQSLTQLVQPGETTRDTLRWASREELGETGWQVAQRLADARLVITDRSADGQEHATLVHETLLRHWERLRDWLEEDRALRLWQRRMRPLLRQWEATGRDANLLLRGTLLTEAERWDTERPASLSALERSFTDASIAQRQTEQVIEADRFLGDLAQLQAMTELEVKVKGLLRWRRVSNGVIGLLVLLIACLAFC